MTRNPGEIVENVGVHIGGIDYRAWIFPSLDKIPVSDETVRFSGYRIQLGADVIIIAHDTNTEASFFISADNIGWAAV